MKKYSTIKSVIIGYIISSILAVFLPNIPLSDILAVIIFILGGFIATYVSITNEARIGLYEGILYSIGSLIVLFSSGHRLTFYSVFIFLSIPLLGLIGGFIAKQLRLRLDNGKELEENANYNGYLVCDKCNRYYKLQLGEFPYDFDKCECGGNLKYYENIEE